MIGIVIPTLNRPDFVVRQLCYYNEAGGDVAVYVGDGSTDASMAIVADAIARLPGLRAVHLDCRGMNDRQTIFRLVTSVLEPYCAYAGDDDYLVPSALRRFAAFLGENPGYRTVQGRGIAFSIAGDGPYGELTACANYWSAPSAESDPPDDRLLAYGQRYWVPLFSLHRTHEFVDDWEPFADLPDRSFGELAPNFMTIARGKSKFIDCLHLARQVHRRRYDLPEPMDWLATPDWHLSYRTFEDRIAEALVAGRAPPDSAARKAVRRAFGTYLANQFTKQQRRLAAADTGGVPQQWLRALPAGPFVRAGKALRDILSPLRGLSLPRLRRAASPYHDAFAPILRSLRG